MTVVKKEQGQDNYFNQQGVAQHWRNFLENYPFKIGFFWRSPKNGMGGGGWCTLRKAEAWRLWCGSRQNSRYGVTSPPGACFMQIPASESLLFLFSLTEGANSGRIWRSSQTSLIPAPIFHYTHATWCTDRHIAFAKNTALGTRLRPNPHACDWVGVVDGRGPCHFNSVFSGEATLLHSSGVISCACSELWWNYLV